MLNIKKKSQIIVLLILIIAVGIKTNFFRNLAEVALHKFDDRIINKYGYCSGESIGYLLYLKKKYQIKDNPKIVNYVHVADANWAIVNTKIIDKNSKKLILLNYPGSEIKMNLKKINNNLFELHNTSFFSDKFNKIESIEILSNSINSKKIDWNLEIITVDRSGNKKIVEEFNIKNFLGKSLIIKSNSLNLNESLNLDKKKLYFKIKNKNNVHIEDIRMGVILKNKYILEDFQIINKINNCYYIK